MNVVRLCFQCELEREDGDRIQLCPVVSNPIYDKSKTNKFQFYNPKRLTSFVQTTQANLQFPHYHDIE